MKIKARIEFGTILSNMVLGSSDKVINQVLKHEREQPDWVTDLSVFGAERKVIGGTWLCSLTNNIFANQR
jgi:hypothetical protein